MKRLSSYNNFINENVQAAKALLKKIGKETGDPAYKQIIKWLGNATGYTHWFVKQHFQNGATLEEIEQIIETIKRDKSIIDRFSTPVIQLENCEKFWDEYLAQSRNAEAKLAYNEFPARQKKLLDLSNPNHIQLLKDLWKDEDKRTFLSKLASYTNKDQLLKNLNNHLYFKTSKVTEELLTNLKAEKVNIVYADLKKDIIITTVTHEQIVKFCSDTAWCIMRSSGMFDSYINDFDYFALQFVIFLPARTDTLRKIGVTNGITTMVTAHDMLDGYIPEDRVFKILKEYEISDKDFFFDEVKKQINESDYDACPVEVLLKIGRSKKEILQKKQIYPKSYRQLRTISGANRQFKNDLEFFTKEEIEEYNILDKTELDLQDLRILGIKKVLEKKLWNRVLNLKFEDLALVGPIDYETAIEIAKAPKFKNSFNSLAKSFVRRKREVMIREFGSNYRMIPLILFLRTKEEERQDFSISYDYFSDKIKYWLFVDIEKRSDIKVRFSGYAEMLMILSQFYKLTEVRLKITFKNVKLLPDLVETLDKHKIVEENKLGNKQEQIRDWLVEIIIDKILNPEERRDTPIKPELLQKIKKAVDDETYKKIWTKLRNRILESYEIQYDIREILFANNEINFDFFKFWNLDNTSTPFKFWGDIFSMRRSDALVKIDKINQWMIKIGYDKTTEQYFQLFKKIWSSADGLDAAFWIFCLQNNIGGNETKKKLIEQMELDKLKYLSSDDIKSIRSLAGEEAAEEFMTIYYYNYAKEQTTRNIHNPDWINIYYPVLKYNLDRVKRDGYQIHIINALASLNKEEELEELNITIDNKGLAASLAEIIMDRPVYLRNPANKETKKIIWKYLKEKTKLEEKEQVEFDKEFLVCAWIMNDDKIIQKCFDKIKTLKNNEQYYGRSYEDGKKFRTNKVYALEPLLKYLDGSKDKTSILQVLSNFKLNKFEKNWAKRNLNPQISEMFEEEKMERFVFTKYSSFRNNI